MLVPDGLSGSQCCLPPPPVPRGQQPCQPHHHCLTSMQGGSEMLQSISLSIPRVLFYSCKGPQVCINWSHGKVQSSRSMSSVSTVTTVQVVNVHPMLVLLPSLTSQSHGQSTTIMASRTLSHGLHQGGALGTELLQDWQPKEAQTPVCHIQTGLTAAHPLLDRHGKLKSQSVAQTSACFIDGLNKDRTSGTDSMKNHWPLIRSTQNFQGVMLVFSLTTSQ